MIVNQLKERQGDHQWNINVRVDFVDNTNLTSALPIDQTEEVQRFMDWYRNPGKIKVWTWVSPDTSDISLFHHDRITGVVITGYIEPEGRGSRWYERIIDRAKSCWVLRRCRKKMEP